MERQIERNVVNSLLSILIDYVVNNLSIYEKSNLESLHLLPVNIRNRLLRKLTSASYFSRNVIFTKLLQAFVNINTTRINLTSILITDEVLNILCLCQNLKKLELTMEGSNCKFSSDGLINLLSNTQKLENLIVARSSVVNDEVLICLSRCCPELQGLDVGGCVNVTDEGLEFLKDMNIKWLRISSTRITDKGIISLAQGKCGQTLEEFMIDNCVNVTHIGLNRITQCCPNLTILNFSNCGTDISTTDVLTFKHPLKQLFWQIPFLKLRHLFKTFSLR